VLLCAAVAAAALLIPLDAQFTGSVRITTAVGLLMALLWLTEALPLGLTALIPLIAFPLTGIATMEKTAGPYANPAVFLFLGGFLVAATFERWGLHRRIAFFALRRVGTEPRRIVFAVLLTTAFLSMWMSNTATTLMMTPIAVAIVSGLGARREGADPAVVGVAEATLLGVAYGASLGGIGTPIGTPTNLIFFGAARELFPHAPTVSFAQWMGFGVAYLLILVPVCWLIIITASRVRKGAAIPFERLGLERPGAMSRGEKTALALCAATALLWIFRADIDLGAFKVPGWGSLFANPRAINDATIAIAMAFLAFLLPVGRKERLLDWSEFSRVPWDVLILFGGGFALADALETSGFSKWAGARLSFVGNWPPVLMIVVLCIVVTLLSEVASNVATAATMMPGAMTRAGLLLDLAAAVVITLLMFTVIPWATGIDLFKPLAR
jgi:sodium-dependent dicarboxylate transporter 2/3/5